MSGAKCASYRVVSEAELRRRRIAAARSRFDRLLQEVAALDAEIAGARSAYGNVGSTRIVAHAPAADDAAVWERACEELDVKLTEGRVAIDRAIVDARVANLQQLVVGMPIVAESPDRDAARPATPSVPARDRIAEALAAMPASASDSEIEMIRAMVTGARPQDASQVLARVRYEVQRLQDRDRRTVANRRMLEELQAELDGLDGDEVARTRGMLRGLDPQDAPPNGLRDLVAAVRARADAERDAIFARAAAHDVLRELGYDVGEDFATAVPREGALIDLPAHAVHGIRVRTRDGRLLFNVVRFDKEHRRNAADDTEAETAFCKDFTEFKRRMDERGIELDMLRADLPGAAPVEVVSVRRASSGTHRAVRDVIREREVGGDGGSAP